MTTDSAHVVIRATAEPASLAPAIRDFDDFLSGSIAGIYGVFSYVVTQQTREIGVRMALGARPAQMMSRMLARAGALAGIGAAIGVVGAYFLMTLLARQLYGIQPRDPATFAAAAAALILVALCACAVPARRAMRIDPATALRCE